VAIVSDDNDTRQRLWSVLADEGWTVHDASYDPDSLFDRSGLTPAVVVVHLGRPRAATQMAARLRSDDFEGVIVLFCPVGDRQGPDKAAALDLSCVTVRDDAELCDVLASRPTWGGSPGPPARGAPPEPPGDRATRKLGL
jgi:hypothetical protein